MEPSETNHQTQLEPSVFDESLDKEDDGKAGINQMLQRDFVDKRECTSDSGASCNSSQSIDQLRSRIVKRPTLFTKSTRDLGVDSVGKVILLNPQVAHCTLHDTIP